MKLFLGRLPSDALSQDISRHFEKWGDVVSVTVKSGYGFVEFKESKEAEAAMEAMRERPEFMGERIVVEPAKGRSEKSLSDRRGERNDGREGERDDRRDFAREDRRDDSRENRRDFSRDDRREARREYSPDNRRDFSRDDRRDFSRDDRREYSDRYRDYRSNDRSYSRERRSYDRPYSRDDRLYDRSRLRSRSPPRRGKLAAYNDALRILITNLPSSSSWQDMKDLVKRAGLDAVYCEAHKRRTGEGIVELQNEEDFKEALRKIDGMEYRGNILQVTRVLQ